VNRLPCCIPTAYDGLSQTIVHSQTCATPEVVLTPAEMAQWRNHPMTYKGSHLKVVDARTPTPTGWRGWWNVGFRDPAWEDFS